MTIYRIGIVLVFTVRSVVGAQERALPARGDENILHALVRVGQAGNIPMGIIQPRDGALCRTITGIIPEHPPNTAEAIRRLAEQAEYEVVQSGAAFVVRPRNVQGKLATWMNYRLEGFGGIGGDMRYMGGVLEGWLVMTVDGVGGYAVSSASSLEAKPLKLPKFNSSTTVEIASRIVELGPKGVWVLSEHLDPAGKLPVIHIRTYSYEDNIHDLDNLPCAVPTKENIKPNLGVERPRRTK